MTPSPRRGRTRIFAPLLVAMLSGACAVGAPTGHERSGSSEAPLVLLVTDLTIDSVSVFAPTPEGGRTLQATLTFAVHNVGNTNITTPFRTLVTTGTTSDYVTTPSLAPGQSAYVSLTYDLPASGTRAFQMTADADHVIAETNESNNTQSTSTNILRPAPGQWLSIGPRSLDGLYTGALFEVAVDPHDANVVWAAGTHASGGYGSHIDSRSGKGVWKSIDTGATWVPVGNGLPSLDITSLAIDPQDSSTVYAATDRGLYATNDGGRSWRPLATDQVGRGLIVDPSNRDRLFMWLDYTGVRRSTDRGVTFQTVLAPAGGTITDLAMDPRVPTSLIAGVQHPTDPSVAGVWKSWDSGTTWSHYTGCGTLPDATGKTIRLAAAALSTHVTFKDDTSFQAFAETGTGCMVNGQWEAFMADHAPSTINPHEMFGGIYADPKDARYVFLGGVQFWRSTDGGNSFTTVSVGHSDHQDVAFAPLAGSMYVAGDGGLFRSIDAGATWTFRANGITSADIYDIADNQLDTAAIAGLQDNGTIRYDGTSTNWHQFWGGDGGPVAVDSKDESTDYIMGQQPSDLKRFQYSPPAIDVGCGLPTDRHDCPSQFQFVVDPLQPHTVLASCGKVYRSTATPVCSSTTDDPWTPEALPSTESFSRAAVDELDRLYFAGAASGNVYYSVLGSAWSQTPLYHGPAVVTDIEVDPAKPTVIYVSFGTYGGAARVVRLVRTAVSTSMTATATSMTASMPSPLTVQSLAVDRVNANTVYAATREQGVWRGQSTDGGTTWTWSAFNFGLPATADVRALTVNAHNGQIRAATYGSGAFEVRTGYLTLSVTQSNPSGTGLGTITSSPSGISCGSTCSATYPMGTSVQLTAVPPTGMVATWTGCYSASGNKCIVDLERNTSVSVTYVCDHAACMNGCESDCLAEGGTYSACFAMCQTDCSDCQ